MATYSHSKLSTFENCKLQYKFKYVDRIKVAIPTTIEMFMGSCVHEALEKLYKDLKYKKLNSEEDLVGFYNKVWERDWSDDVLIAKEYPKENYRAMGAEYLRNYYKEYAPFNQFLIIGLETEEKLKLADGSFYYVRIDRLANLAGTYYVCDYKTNSKLKSQEEADSDRQLAMYSIWVKRHFRDAKRVVLLWHMLAFNKEITSERTSEELEALEKDVIGLIKDIEKEKSFPASPSPLCDYCVYKDLCPSFSHEAKLKKLPLREYQKDEGLKLVNKFALLREKEKEVETQITKVKDDLIGFAKQEKVDVVYGSNNEASVKEYEKALIPEENKEKAEELLKKKGLYEQLSIVSWAKLNAQIVEGNMDKDISKLAKKEKDFKVVLRKKKEEEEE